MAKNKNNFLAGIKEYFRKKLVYLKRNPHVIPFVCLVITFLVYSLKLRIISDTTAKINTSGMGLCGFVTMLFSILSFIAFINSFPHRKKVNIPMLVIFFLMQGSVILCDEIYLSRIMSAITNNPNPKQFITANRFVLDAYNMLNTHVILVAITLGLVVLMPLYTKLLRKINTSIEVEGNDEMGDIEITSEV